MDAVEIRFESADENRSDLESLLTWLRNDRALRGVVEIEAVKGAGPGQMGALLETISLVIASAAGLNDLARSYASWRTGSRARSDVTVIVVSPEAAEVEGVLRQFGVLPPTGAAPGEPGTTDATVQDATAQDEVGA